MKKKEWSYCMWYSEMTCRIRGIAAVVWTSSCLAIALTSAFLVLTISHHAQAQSQIKKQLDFLANQTGCRSDIVVHCKGITAGRGRLYNCLNKNKAKLTESCIKALPKAKKLLIQAGVLGRSAARTKAQLTALEVLFVKADRNGDLVLNKAEVLIITLAQFDQSDSDRDGLLEKQEVGKLSSDKEFTDNDTSGDGSLSIEEVIAEKLADFKNADTNNDGVLSFDEVKKYYKNKKKN